MRLVLRRTTMASRLASKCSIIRLRASSRPGLFVKEYPTFARPALCLLPWIVLATVIVAASRLDAQESAPLTNSSSTEPVDGSGNATDEHGGPGNQFRQAFESAVAHHQHAIQVDPEIASNYIGLADCQLMLWCFGFRPGNEVLPSANAATTKAIELDDRLATAHTTLGVLHLSRWEWTAAEREFRLAIELDPNSAKARHWYALYLAAMVRHDEALQQSEQALELEPNSGYRTGLGAVLYFRRDFARMIHVMEHTVSVDPEFAPGYDWLGMAYVQSGRVEDSLLVYRKAVALSGGLAEIKAGLGHAYAVAGNKDEAKQVLDDLNQLSQRWHIPPVQIAFVHVGLGEKDEAFRRLEEAFQEKSWELAFLQVEPWLDDLRSDPRFADLLRRMDFPK